MPSASFLAIAAQLQTAFDSSAFRRSTSAFRYGLIPNGPSDHLPIKSILTMQKTSVSVVSWNLLSHAHLYNNFMNITGSRYFAHALQQQGEVNNIYYNESAAYQCFPQHRYTGLL